HLPQSVHVTKSTVLAGAGVQDAYWSDDDDEDAECPLCLEEMDVAEMSFKPCPCGYQICMFCYHHIKSNLNGRCPACRREYLEENVEFTAVASEDIKRQTQQKKRKERERKELESLGRRHFANVRVVQRNVVYVVGLGPRFAKEELIPTLRSNEYFGQYGKISKIILVKRHLPGSKSPIVGLYITYHRREDATRAINAVDGSPSPGGGSDVMRASHGTTKYCMSFLRGLSCSNNNCLDLHEWGDKNDCFTKEDLTTLKHSMKDSESQSRLSIHKKEELESTTLPRGSSWGPKPSAAQNSQPTTARPPRAITGRTRNPPSVRATAPVVEHPPRLGNRGHDRRAPAHASISSTTSVSSKPVEKANSQPSSSRPSTPAAPTIIPQVRPVSPAVSAITRTRAMELPLRSVTPASSIAVESDVGSSNPDIDSHRSPLVIEAAPSAPPGLPPPTYQLSTQAQALLDDVRARRDQVMQPHVPSPFPEFDRTLDNLGGGEFSFKWTMDPKLSGTTVNNAPEYQGSFDPFAASLGTTSQQRHLKRQFPQLSGPPGLSPPSPAPVQTHSGYHGSFNPFADAEDNFATQSLPDSGDGSRQESRFGFARRRASPTANDSPNMAAFVASPPTSGSPASMHQHMDGSWGYQGQIQTHSHANFNQQLLSGHRSAYEYTHPPGVSVPNISSSLSSPTFHNEHTPFSPPGPRFQPFEVTEADRLRSALYGTETSHMLKDHASQATSFVGPQGLIDQAYTTHQQPPFAFGGPPGLSPRDSAPSSTFSPIYSEPLQRQPSPLKMGTPSSQRESSMSSTPAYGELSLPFNEGRVSLVQADESSFHPSSILASPHPSPAQPSAKLVAPAAPVLLATDFPALPTPPAPEINSKREQTQPYILPTSMKPSDAKALSQTSVLARKSQVAPQPKPSLKEVKAVPKPIEVTTKSTAPVTAVALSTIGAGKSVKSRKQDKKSAPETPAYSSVPSEVKKNVKPSITPRPNAPPPPPPEPVQAPLFSKVSKKAKPIQPKVAKPKDKDDQLTSKPTTSEPVTETATVVASATSKQAVAEIPQSDAPASPAIISEPHSMPSLLDQLTRKGLDVASMTFFNPESLDADSQTPLQYDPLVHALSALSVGGGSFANNLPAVSIDSAVSSFQQLLETLTQTISDLLRLLPRTTWDDSSSFDGVLRDMLKGDDFLDDVVDDNGKDDEVAALTLALERRARWMEVQLAKLEELHRDINTAAVRAVLTFNDRGWDPTGFMPKSGKSLVRFDNIGYVQGKGKSTRQMTLEELQKASDKAKNEERTARQSLVESMEKLSVLLP
ncbi:hypothetical protein BU17DRAFT_8811, partial [Hysterangium stoloniferum]